jgi:hypothetical protein
MLLATMRPPVPAEVALWAFFEEHRRCDDFDAGVEDGTSLDEVRVRSGAGAESSFGLVNCFVEPVVVAEMGGQLGNSMGALTPT